MANDSEAVGRLMLIGKWTPEMLKLFKSVCEKWGKWRFYFDVDVNVIHQKYTTPYRNFWGCGKWAFTRNVEELDKWSRMEKDLVPTYEKLIELMHENGSSILIDFVDREGGLEVLYKAQFILHTAFNKLADNRLELVSHEVYSQGYEWSIENEKKLGFDSPWPREIDGNIVDSYEQLESMSTAVAV